MAINNFAPMEGSSFWLRESSVQVCCRPSDFWEWLSETRSCFYCEEGACAILPLTLYIYT